MLWIRLVVEIQMANGIQTKPCYHSLIKFRLWRRQSLLQWTVYCGNKLFYSCQWFDSVLNLVERDTSRKKNNQKSSWIVFLSLSWSSTFFWKQDGVFNFLTWLNYSYYFYYIFLLSWLLLPRMISQYVLIN